MRIRVKEVGKGLHPSEVVIQVRTADGRHEKLVVDRRSVEHGTLNVGYPVGEDQDRVLVELPRESLRGLWRIWVGHDSMVEEVAA